MLNLDNLGRALCLRTLCLRSLLPLSLPPLLLLPLLLLPLLVLPACDGEDPGTPDGGSSKRRLEIIEPGTDVGLSRGGQKTLRIRYTDVSGGGPAGISNASIHFAIFGDPRGSTLSSDAAVTDSAGVAAMQVRAGATSSRFQVRVSATDAQDVTFHIEVSDAGFGSLRINATYGGGAVTSDKLKKLTYSLYGDIACSSINPASPPPSLRTRAASGVTQTVSFKALPINLNHTIAAAARTYGSTTPGNGWTMQATGCVALPAGLLRDGRELSLTIKLTDLPLTAIGKYALSSKITLPKTNRPLADAVKPWGQLVDCPYGPAQRLLDCALDAIDGSDPLDCMIVAPSGKTQALMAERGSISGVCRGATSPLKTTSLEKLLTASMNKTGLAKLTSAAGTVEARAASVLSGLDLTSTLTIHAAASDGNVVTSHQLGTVSFRDKKNVATYKVVDVGLPQWLASPITGSVDAKRRITLAEHGFSLRYGLLARKALGVLVLTPLGLEADSTKQANALANLTTTKISGSGKTVQGCAAIDAVACQAARLAPGCLGKACSDGIQALAESLDEGFKQIDGQHTDLTLEGEALLIDSNSDLVVDGIGSGSAPGTWTASFSMGKEKVVATEATFLGKSE